MADKRISELIAATSVLSTDLSVLVKEGVDYKFTFDQLLQFINANVNAGATISFGTVLPTNITGRNGDLFIKTDEGKFAQRVNGVWTVRYTIPSVGDGDGAVIYGEGAPDSGTGKNLDTYIDVLTGIFYLKGAGSWSQVFSMATGPAGPRGFSVLNGAVDPNSGNGVNGDFFLNTTTYTMFGPKAAGAWPAGVLIKGTNGNTILHGTNNPSNVDDGVDGDFYINTGTLYIFGPKTAGVWGAGTPLFGDYYTTELVYASGAANPIVITDWQATYVTNLGNRPSIAVIQAIPDDGDGNPAEIDRTDLRPLRYYSDSPTNTLCTSIKIDTGDGATLSSKYIIKLSK